MSDVTHILNAIDQGDSRAIDKLLPVVYDELRRLAARKLYHERPTQTLQATALVHEAYIRLVKGETQSWSSRSHFFSVAAEAMRRILIESARRKKRLKRGGEHHKVDFEDATMMIEEPSEKIIALDEALTKLSKQNSMAAEIVKLRYFAGLTIEQAANALCVSRRTANRYWAYARAWLYQEINKETSQEAN